MRSGAHLAFAAVALAAVAAVLVVASGDERDLAFTLGVRPVKVVAQLPPGRRACQSPLLVQERFRSVRFEVGGKWPVGVSLDFTVKRAGRLLAAGRLEGGYPVPSEPRVRLDRSVPADIDGVAVCLHNRGAIPLALVGDIEGGLGPGELRVEGRSLSADMKMVFLRERPRSALSLVPEMFRRAALFRPTWVGAWTFWILLALVAAGVPPLLARALGAAAADQAGAGSRTRSAERSASST